MRGFLGAVTGYPTVFFTFALVVVVAYWVLVLFGGAHLHGARGGHHGHVHTGGAGKAGVAGRVGGSGRAGAAAGQSGSAGHGPGHGHGPSHGNGQGQSHGHAQGHGRAQGHGHDQGHGHGESPALDSGRVGGRVGGRHGRGGVQRMLGLGGVPITVAVSLVVAFAWFTALAGRALAGDGGADGGATHWLLLPAALVGGWAGARVMVWPLRRMMPEPPPPPSRRDFVGRDCVIRTGRVGPDFGQAEVRAADGSSAVVQVRQSVEDAAGTGGGLGHGVAALIYDYDAEGEFFWVMPAPSG